MTTTAKTAATETRFPVIETVPLGYNWLDSADSTRSFHATMPDGCSAFAYRFPPDRRRIALPNAFRYGKLRPGRLNAAIWRTDGSPMERTVTARLLGLLLAAIVVVSGAFRCGRRLACALSR